MTTQIKCDLCKEIEDVKENKHLVIEVMDFHLGDYNHKSIWGCDICKKCLLRLKDTPFKIKGGNKTKR